jgi:hypothetical protein
MNHMFIFLMGHDSPTISKLAVSNGGITPVASCLLQGIGFTLAKIYWFAPQELLVRVWRHK